MADSSSSSIKTIGAGLSALGDIQTGLNALSVANTNASLYKKQGNDAFSKIMSDMKEAVGSYQATQGASGLISNSAKDVQRAGESKGISDAVNARYNANIAAANSAYKGQTARAQGFIGAGTTALGAF